MMGIKNKISVSNGGVRTIFNPIQAKQIITTELATAVPLGRKLLDDPYWPLCATRIFGNNHIWPVQCERGRKPTKHFITEDVFRIESTKL